MRLSVIGAGSTYTPELIEGLISRREQLPVDDLVLHDVDAGRLAVVSGLARRMLSAAGMGVRVHVVDDLDEAVTGADAVFVQIRIGGQAARLADETLPGRFGLLGQETTGAGGFAKALRTVPVVLHIADRVRELAAPDAWLVNFTNPVGIVTRALLDAGHRAVGLCNFAIGAERRMAGFLGVDPARVRAVSVGLNHLSWVRGVLVDGEDVLPRLLGSDYADSLARELHVDRSLFHTLGAFPSYYLRYYYDREQVVIDQRTEVPRARAVADLEAELLRSYADPALCTKPALLEGRGGAFYSEAAAALVTSLLTGDARPQVVNNYNRGAIAGLPDDVVVEVPFVVDGDGTHPPQLPPLAPEMLGLVQAVTGYESLTASAAVTGDREVAARALLAHPLIGQWRLVEPLLDALLAANQRYLPAFAAPAP